jgi:hypothetical protein
MKLDAQLQAQGTVSMTDRGNSTKPSAGNETDGRTTFIWRGDDSPDRTVWPPKTSNEDRLVALIADKAVDELFSEEGQLVYLQDGQLVPVNVQYMAAIIEKYVKTPRLINHGTAEEPRWGLEYCSFEFPVEGSRRAPARGPTQKTLLNMVGALPALVCKTPRRWVEFKPAQLDMIKTQLKSGESARRIADYLRCDVLQIHEVANREGTPAHA